MPDDSHLNTLNEKLSVTYLDQEAWIQVNYDCNLLTFQHQRKCQVLLALTRHNYRQPPSTF